MTGAETGSRRTVIITGASRGIGHATAKAFLERGWRILTCSRDEAPPECKRDANWTCHIPTDLADPASIARFIAEANSLLAEGPLHALVNNAGMSPKTPIKERLGCLNGDLDAWREVLEINFFAPLRLVRGFAKALHRGKGAVVNVTSIAGHVIHPGDPLRGGAAMTCGRYNRGSDRKLDDFRFIGGSTHQPDTNPVRGRASRY